MSLSSFGYDVLVLLDDAKSPLSAETLADQLSNERHGHISAGVVGIHLEHALTRYVCQTEDGKWEIDSPHHGKFSHSKRQAVEDGDGEGGEDTQSDADAVESLDEVSQMIVRVLADADVPLLAKQITREVSNRFDDIPQVKVNRRLYNELSGLTKKDTEHRWKLVSREHTETESDIDEEHQGSDESEENDQDRAEEQNEKRDSVDSSDESTDELLEAALPSARTGKINRKLEVAKHITRVLDLSPQPLSAKHLTQLLSLSGREVEEKKVHGCLESVLEPFVVEKEGEYCLKENTWEDGDELSQEPSRVDETDKTDSEKKPIDSVTRASVSGRRFEYVFETKKLDTTSLFASQIRGGTVEIRLNKSHFAFDRFKHVLNSEVSDGRATADQLRELVRLLIVAWTEIEGDLSGRRRELAEEIRDDWGRALRSLLQTNEEQ